MPSPEEILAVVRELQPQFSALLGEEAAEVQNQISPLIEQLASGQSDGAGLLKVLCAYPALKEELLQRLELQIDEYSRDTRGSKGAYQKPPGTPPSAIAGKRYICPVPDCPEEWFRMRVGQSPPLCEEHGVVMVKAEDMVQAKDKG
ncbi:MAG: hypothetical protein AAFY54_04625 [Cyanobacteria bacterium J06648_10]